MRELSLPDAARIVGGDFAVLLQEGDLPVTDPDGHQVAVVAPVEEFLARPFLCLPFEGGYQVVAVEVDLEGLGARRVALGDLRDEIRLTRRSCKRRDQV